MFVNLFVEQKHVINILLIYHSFLKKKSWHNKCNHYKNNLCLNDLGDELFKLERPADALYYYEQALNREVSNICDTIFILRKICDCYLALGDHHNALKVSR